MSVRTISRGLGSSWAKASGDRSTEAASPGAGAHESSWLAILVGMRSLSGTGRTDRAVGSKPQVTRLGVPEAGIDSVEPVRSPGSAASDGFGRVRPGSTRRSGPR